MTERSIFDDEAIEAAYYKYRSIPPQMTFRSAIEAALRAAEASLRERGKLEIEERTVQFNDEKGRSKLRQFQVAVITLSEGE